MWLKKAYKGAHSISSLRDLDWLRLSETCGLSTIGWLGSVTEASWVVAHHNLNSSWRSSVLVLSASAAPDNVASNTVGDSHVTHDTEHDNLHDAEPNEDERDDDNDNDSSCC